LPHGHVDACPRHGAPDRPSIGCSAPGLPRHSLGESLPRPHFWPWWLAASSIPGSKLAAARALSPDTASSSLGEQLGLGVVDEDELYSALDWLAVRQPAIEAALAKRHLSGGTTGALRRVVELPGRPLLPARPIRLQPRRQAGKLQIVYGLLCAGDGCPVAIEVFAGSTADPATLPSQVTKLKERFGLDHCRAGRRPRHDHPGADQRGHQIGRARLDHRLARPGN